MKISFITIFPEYFQAFKNHSIIKKAIDKKSIVVEEINIRNFAKNRKVDDYIFGGGPGMLMLIEPIVKAIESIKTSDSYIILTSPKGKNYNQSVAKEFSKKKHLIIVCGHYEGIDSRIKNFIDEEISLGEFIVTGGETIAVTIADSIIRLIPGIINEESLKEESFDENKIECDHFSKPREFRGLKVPEVLLSGDHKKIEEWRKNSSEKNTFKYLLNKK